MSTQWYVYKGGQQNGPYSFEHLVEEANSGRLEPADMLWSAGMEGWTRAEQVKGLNPVARHQTGAIPTQPAAAAGAPNAPAHAAKLEQLSKWMGFVGIVTIIGGVLSAISGVFAFVIGALPGIITIIMGVLLRKAKKHTDAILFEDAVERYSANFSKLVGSLNAYFKIMSILIIIGLVLGVLAVIFGLIAGASLMNYFDTLDFL